MRKGISTAVCVSAILLTMVTLGMRLAHSQDDKIDWETIARNNETTYHFNGVITGRVRLDNGKPAVGFLVRAYFDLHQSDAAGEGAAITDAEGNYRIHGLNPQGFRVQVENGGQPYLADPARHILLKPDRAITNRVDFTLYLTPLVTVRIHDAQTGEAISGIKVFAYPYGTSSTDPLGVTDAKGELRFRPINMETQINLDNVQLGDRRLSMAPGSWMNHRVTLPKLSGNRDMVLDFKTYAETPERQNTIFHGVVTSPDGKSIAGAEIGIAREGTSETVHGVTNEKGEFAIPTYRMQAVEFGNWNGQERRGILITAEKGKMRTAHLATPEETWTSIPIHLSAAGLASVRGQVVNPEGKPLANVPFAFMEFYADADAIMPKEGGVTDAQGNFELKRLLSEARYQLSFGHPSQNGNDFGFGNTSYPDVGYARGWMQLKRGERRNLGNIVVWEAKKQVAGRLFGVNGQAVKGNFLLRVIGDHTESIAYPDSDGSFRLKGLVDEPLMLYVFESTDPHFYRSSPGSPDEVLHLPVRPGDESVKVLLNR